MPWQLFTNSGPDIQSALAIDEAFARMLVNRSEKINTLRLWNVSRAVAIGRMQCVHKEVDINYCKQNGITIARRFTGGGTVYMDRGNLNFTLCMTQSDPNVPRKLMDVYSKFVGCISQGLNTIDIPVKYDPDRSCLRLNGRKITGTAGWIKQGVSFIHGTLLINADLQTLERCLTVPDNQQVYRRDNTRIRCKPSSRDVVTNIHDEILDGPSEDEIRAAIVESIESLVEEKMKEGKADSWEIEVRESLYHERYKQPSWNLGTPVYEDN
jgi:lipoate-protein ligase A